MNDNNDEFNSISSLLVTRENELIKFRYNQINLLEKKLKEVEKENKVLKSNSHRVKADFEHNLNIIKEQTNDIKKLEKLSQSFQLVLKEKAIQEKELKREITELEKYRTEIKALEIELKHEKKNINRIQAEFDTKCTELKAKENKMFHLKDVNRQLKHLLNSFCKKVEVFVGFVRDSTHLNITHGVVVKLNTIFSSHRHRIHKILSSVEDFNNESIRLRHLNESLKKRIGNAESENKQTKEEKAVLKNANLELESVVKVLQERLSAKEAEAATSFDKVANENICLHKEYEKQQKHSKKLAQALKVKEEENDRIEGSIILLEEKAKYDVEKVKEEMKTTFKTKIEQLLKQKNQLKQHSTRLIELMKASSMSNSYPPPQPLIMQQPTEDKVSSSILFQQLDAERRCTKRKEEEVIKQQTLVHKLEAEASKHLIQIKHYKRRLKAEKARCDELSKKVSHLTVELKNRQNIPSPLSKNKIKQASILKNNTGLAMISPIPTLDVDFLSNQPIPQVEVKKSVLLPTCDCVNNAQTIQELKITKSELNQYKKYIQEANCKITKQRDENEALKLNNENLKRIIAKSEREAKSMQLKFNEIVQTTKILIEQNQKLKKFNKTTTEISNISKENDDKSNILHHNLEQILSSFQ